MTIPDGLPEHCTWCIECLEHHALKPKKRCPSCAPDEYEVRTKFGTTIPTGTGTGSFNGGIPA